MLSGVDVRDVIKIAVEAGREILDVYDSGDFEIEQKQDKSPLTLADKKSHRVIAAGLAKLNEGVPVLSEEGKHQPYRERESWDSVWVVDPLDGTKEFIKRNGEFTVNIALVHRGVPVLGVIYAPVLDVIYYAAVGTGSFKVEEARKHMSGDVNAEAVRLPIDTSGDTVYVVASRSHMSPETEEYVNEVRLKYGRVNIKSAGSSLKLCLVAEGKADVYPRFAPTMEWDTCAGQVVVEQSGGKVVQVDSGERLTYNKENLLNPWFVAKRGNFEL
ncbi:3'(2'),5'-bisphosphate nucleotidase CysQ [Alicyclobacillus mengziensis]|uniref:3'(2'),5'-bisphosphate nucleotidase CysQ n=1 Tax=Alicyclobacillus mengziensis TaxID=2931921 RepID=A0A9X7VXM8_9BACL|nr:3'(2'),5'-bisphosphate nucleotidase CysQ [Alicyclobacillus mengziensis]QSO46929.1 3'(2'),5'-bisphosphate nucleotidase CysQ [Alicyclobacillus mengziensis]